jgi:myo-inositol-1(or 4)-monophosphatase
MWMEILRETAEETRRQLTPLFKNRGAVSPSELSELKNLLDAEAEAAVEETLKRKGVQARIISEEAELQIGGGSETRIIVDPLDGTNNMGRGFPLAAVSLAVSETPYFAGVVAGLVMNLYTGETYSAERGGGALLDGRPISTSKITSLGEALLSIDVSKSGHVKLLEHLLMRAQHLRQLGSAALSLSFVSAGVLDAYVDLRGLIRVTDIAAGLLILREAGGVIHVVGESLDEIELERDRTLSLVASGNRPLMEEILKCLELDAAE